MKNDKFFISFLEKISDFVMLTDKNEHVIFVNSAFSDFFQINQSIEDLHFKTVLRLIGILDYELFLQKGLSRVYRQSIDEKNINWNIFYTGDENLIVGRLYKNYDEETIEIYSQLIENIPVNIYWMDKHCRMVGANKKVLDIVKMNIQEYKGLTYEQLAEKLDWPLSLVKKYENDDKTVISTGKPLLNLIDPPIPDVNGKNLYQVTNRIPLRDCNKNIIGVAGISVNVSELKSTQEELEKALIAAKQANTERKNILERYHQFMEDQEHDIRTPIGGIVAGTEVLTDMAEKLPEECIEMVSLIHNAAEQALDYQESLLYDLYQGIREGKTIFTRFNLPDIVHRIDTLYQPKLRAKKLNFKCEVDTEIPDYLKGDAKKVYQCLVDLMSNAVRFTNAGSVHLKIQFIEQKDRQIKIRFSVIDTGVGIPRERHNEVYEAFVKVDPSNTTHGHGRGLGLSRVQHLVNLMQGELWFDSKAGEGSQFHMTIPFELSIDQKA